MAQTKNKLASELVTIGQRLLAVGKELASGSDSEPVRIAGELPPIQEKLSRQECLQCGKTVTGGEPYRRGLCASDYQKTKRRIDSGIVTADELIAKGWYTPEAGKGGRKSIAKDIVGEYIANRGEVVQTLDGFFGASDTKAKSRKGRAASEKSGHRSGQAKK